MTRPHDEGREQKLDEETMTTGILRGVDQAAGLGRQVVPPAEPEPYVKEPLFSKKVLFGWAAAALLVWFAFTVIRPVVVESIKAAVVSKMEAPGSGTPQKKVIVTPNGTRITIDERGVTVDRHVTGAAAVPAAPKAAPAPVVEAVTVVPAPAAPKKAAEQTAPRR